MKKKDMTRSLAAVKASVTRKARRELENTYGPMTYDIAEMVMKGYTCTSIADELFLHLPSVAATVANINRDGHLSDLVDECNF